MSSLFTDQTAIVALPGATAAARGVAADRAAQRIDWVDYAKGMAIFLVVLGHALCGMINAHLPVPRGSDYAIDWMYSFHMPLFFFLSGMFVLPALRKGLDRFVVHRMGHVLYCYVVWSVLNTLIRCSFGSYTNFRPEWSMLEQSWRVPIGELWFLYVLLLYYAAFAIFYTLKLPPWSALLLGVVCLALWQCQMVHVGGWNVLQKALEHFFYFALGACAGNIRWAPRLGAASSAVVSAVCFGVFSWSIYCRAFAGPLKTPVALLGILGTVLAANVLAQRSWCRSVRSMGVATLAIYLAHTCFTAGWRIICQKMLHLEALPIDAAACILVVGVVLGVWGPMLLQAVLNRWRFPYLFAFR